MCTLVAARLFANVSHNIHATVVCEAEATVDVKRKFVYD
jgi:hypothetical protein